MAAMATLELQILFSILLFFCFECAGNFYYYSKVNFTLLGHIFSVNNMVQKKMFRFYPNYCVT